MLIDEVPKYGNDIDYVDNLVVEAYDSYLDEIKNIQILVIIEVQSVVFAMVVHLQSVLM